MITIDEFEAYWFRTSETSTFEYRHHARTGQVSLEVALGAFVRETDPNIGITVESIDVGQKIVVTSSYGIAVDGLVDAEDDGIRAREDGYGYVFVFSYTGDREVHGVDGSYGFHLFEMMVWAFLHKSPEMRGKDVQRQFEEYEAQQRELQLTL